MTTGPLLPGARQGWMNRACPPDHLRDGPCRRRPDLFAPIPITGPLKRDPGERQEIAYRLVRAKRICNGSPGYDEPCPVRMQCLIWALQAKERVVAGGVAITLQMIKGYHEDREGADRAAEEAGAPEDWARQLAARSRKGKRQPDDGAGDRRRSEVA